MGAEWVSAIISGLCAVGSLAGFLLARSEKRKAKASEEKAAAQAEIATEANKSAKNYYDLLVSEEGPKRQKYQIIRYLKRNKSKNRFQDIAIALGMDKNILEDNLLDMLWVDGMVIAMGNPESDIENTLWEPIKRR